jgi:hypothetical protein
MGRRFTPPVAEKETGVGSVSDSKKEQSVGEAIGETEVTSAVGQPVGVEAIVDLILDRVRKTLEAS